MLSSEIRQNLSRARVLLVAYACSPYKGSESIVGWGRALETARYCETWLLTGPESEPDIKNYLCENGEIPNLHFCFLAADKTEKLLQKLPTLYAHNYLAIRHWQRRAKDFVAQLHARINFDLFHHVNITGYREPGCLWELDVPFVWGPLSGTQNLPWKFLPSLGLVQGGKEFVRNCLNIYQLNTSRRVKKAAQKSLAIVAANSTIQKDFARLTRKEPTLLLETGLSSVADKLPVKNQSHETLRILWSGEHKGFKALPLLLEALAGLPDKVKYELKILGRGPLREKWEQLAQAKNVNAEWLGFVPYTEIMQQYDWADVFVFTSLRDTSGNVMLEALSCGVPVVCLDHQGAADIVTKKSGLKIRVTNPEQVVKDLRDAIATLALNRNKLLKLSQGALARARFFLWSNNGERMAEIYGQALIAANQTATKSAQVVRDIVHAQ